MKFYTIVLSQTALLLSLIFPSGLVFASDLNSKIKPAGNLVISSQIKVSVVYAHPSQEVVVDSASSKLAVASCQFGLQPGWDFLQNALPLNLNQPANCFDLKVSFYKSSAKNLAVFSVPPQTQKVAVIEQKAVITNPSFSTAPISEQGIPALPLVFAGIVVAFGLEQKNTIAKNLKRFSFIKQSLTLCQLQVLRC